MTVIHPPSASRRNSAARSRVLDCSRYDAFIFDLDGTLINSEPYHVHAFAEAMKEVGAYTLTPADKREFTGNTSRDLASTLSRRHRLGLDVDRVVSRKFEILYGVFRTEPFPGVLDFLSLWHGSRPLAIASNSPASFVERVLDELAARHWFEVITTIDDVARRKPDPEMVRITLQALDVPPERALVFEDSAFGLEAARRAGCAPVLVRNPGNRLPDCVPAGTPLVTWPELVAAGPGRAAPARPRTSVGSAV